ncbi:MAG: hypothetical protein H6R07_3359 [Proteobacteria bacterium]|nr:hypothetical protein [Pseudomonadota bacterium]
MVMDVFRVRNKQMLIFVLCLNYLKISISFVLACENLIFK